MDAKSHADGIERQSGSSPGVFIDLPVLNEAENIEKLLDGIGCELQGLDYTVCIIDDGSRDGTLDLVRRAMVEHGSHIHLISRKKRGRGCLRGSALREGLLWGLRHTKHGLFVEMDGDLSHRPEELREGIRHIVEQSFDVVIASKYLLGSLTTNRPIGRRLVSRICNTGVRTVLSRQISDYSNGYRFYTREAARIIARHRIRHGSPIYLTEAMAIWLRHGLRIGEFPSIYVGRNEGLSKVKWFDLLKGAFAVFDVAIRYHLTGFSRSERAPEEEPGALADEKSASPSPMPAIRPRHPTPE